MIAAISGRALAASARRAGFVPLVADFFADADTGAIAHACCKLDGEPRQGMRWRSLTPALEMLAKDAPSPVLGLVYGSGFEARADLLAKLAERWRLIGNEASTVERVKEPNSFFGALARLGVPHPRTRTDAPPTPNGWLAKRLGGAGGSHVVTARYVKTGSRVYFQEIVQGRPVSALFVGNGDRAQVLGFSEQWPAPKRGAKWRYGGAVHPAELSPKLADRMTSAVEQVAARFKLKGLGSADFLVSEGDKEGDRALLLEVNPRPGATLDIFDSEAQPLLRLHLDAVLQDRLPSGPLRQWEASAAATVYATELLAVPRTMVWPDWTADRPKCGERIDKNRPICTVLARAETTVEAERLIEERISMILTACTTKKGGNK